MEAEVCKALSHILEIYIYMCVYITWVSEMSDNNTSFVVRM